MTDHPYEISFLKAVVGGLAMIEYSNPAPTCFELLFRNHFPSPALEFVPVHV
jgi:hypothetical protein